MTSSGRSPDRDTEKIRVVQKALEHSDLSTTMIYMHIVDEELEEAMKGFQPPVCSETGRFDLQWR